ncbi:hypothetical protein PRIPAC_83470 [Pristionchus pacificus]|uniref:Uncharacterized protein n=1 Tax=Pristionchus pacificus TaxID=54126 RepID=A0A2A6BTE2_PRIPA|nr:hypothetical protein PRIPAC_83470 [Pristionchus pacificus]|eukprot:PDM69252.1 hypothetical protein PRIPAC_47554 [Pristionchus pacificus]
MKQKFHREQGRFASVMTATKERRVTNSFYRTKQHNATSPLNPAIKQRARDTVSSRTTASVVCVPQAGLAVTAVQVKR